MAAIEFRVRFLDGTRFYMNAKERLSRISEGKSPLARSCIRSIYWRMFLGCLSPTSTVTWTAQVSRARQEYRQARKLSPPDASTKVQVEKDLARLSCDNMIFFNDYCKAQMCDVLMAFASKNPEMGYRQGMHELLAPIMYAVTMDSRNYDKDRQTQQEQGPSSPIKFTEPLLDTLLDRRQINADAFTMFSRLMTVMGPLYVSQKPVKDKNGNYVDVQTPLLKRVIAVQGEQLQKQAPKLHRHLKKQMIQPQLYLLRWLRLLFAFEFQFEALIEVYDQLFASSVRMASGRGDLPLLDFVALSMLLERSDALLKANNTECLQQLIRYKTDGLERKILQRAVKIYVKQSAAPRMGGRAPPPAPERNVKRSFFSWSSKSRGKKATTAPPTTPADDPKVLRTENLMLKGMIQQMNQQLSERISNLEDRARATAGMSRTVRKVYISLESALQLAAAGGLNVPQNVELAIRDASEKLRSAHDILSDVATGLESDGKSVATGESRGNSRAQAATNTPAVSTGGALPVPDQNTTRNDPSFSLSGVSTMSFRTQTMDTGDVPPIRAVNLPPTVPEQPSATPSVISDTSAALAKPPPILPTGGAARVPPPTSTDKLDDVQSTAESPAEQLPVSQSEPPAEQLPVTQSPAAQPPAAQAVESKPPPPPPMAAAADIKNKPPPPPVNATNGTTSVAALMQPLSSPQAVSAASKPPPPPGGPTQKPVPPPPQDMSAQPPPTLLPRQPSDTPPELPPETTPALEASAEPTQAVPSLLPTASDGGVPAPPPQAVSTVDGPAPVNVSPAPGTPAAAAGPPPPMIETKAHHAKRSNSFADMIKRRASSIGTPKNSAGVSSAGRTSPPTTIAEVDEAPTQTESGVKSSDIPCEPSDAPPSAESVSSPPSQSPVVAEEPAEAAGAAESQPNMQGEITQPPPQEAAATAAPAAAASKEEKKQAKVPFTRDGSVGALFGGMNLAALRAGLGKKKKRRKKRGVSPSSPGRPVATTSAAPPSKSVPAPAPSKPVPVPVPAPSKPVPEPAPSKPVPEPAPSKPVPEPAPSKPVPVPAPSKSVPVPATTPREAQPPVEVKTESDAKLGSTAPTKKMPMPPTAAAAAVGSTEGDPIDLVADEPAADAAPSSTDEHMYVAIFPFAGENEGDLSFSENTILQVLDYCEGEAWWVCRRVNEGDPNEEGYVPSNYLTPMKAPGDATSGDMGLTEAEAAT